AVLERVPDRLPGELGDDGDVAEGQLGEDVAPGELGPRGILLVAADAPAIGDGDVGTVGPAHGIGDEVADRRLLHAHAGAAGVERIGGAADYDVELVGELSLQLVDHRLRVGIALDA